MATSRRRTAKKNLGQNLNDLDRRLKTVERRPRSGVDAWSITADMLAPGLITLDKLSPELLALLQQTYSSGDSTGDTSEEQGYGLTDVLIASAEYSTTAANGKNSLFFSPTAPDEGTYLVDDIWYDTSLDTDGRPKYTPYQWDGDSWEPAPFGDASFRFLNAGKIATGTLDAAQVIRVGQYPTPEGKTRLEISGGNGIVTTTTTLVNAVTETSTTFIVDDATGMPSSGVFTIKVDYGMPSEELVTVTSRSGTTLTVVRGATDSTPFAHDAGAEVQYSSPVYAGITVLKNPVGSGITVQDTSGQASLPALFRLDASEGSLLIQEGDDYLKFNTSDSLGRLSISGRLLVGSGSESVSVGPNISGAQDGIRLGPYNWWYRPGSTLEEFPSGGTFFKVGSGDAGNLISAHTDGTVTVEGVVNPTAGVIKGKLSIRAIAGAVDRIEIGQNVLSNRDGIRIDANNHWTISNTGGSTTFSVGSNSKKLTYDTNADLLKLTGSDILLVGGSLRTKDDNSSTRVVVDESGIFGYKAGTSDPIFYIRTSDGKASFEGETNPTSGVIKGKLTVRGIEGATNRILIGQDVQGNRDGIKLDDNNLWTISNTGGSTAFSVGSDTKKLTYDTVSGLLKLTGGDITLTGGGTFKTADSNTRVEMNSNGIFGYKAGTTDPIFYIRASDGKASFEGETNPTGGTVKGKLTIQGTTYAFGKDVMSVRDGLYLNANNYWTLSQTGATAEFKVGGATKYLEWTGGQLNIRTDTLLIGDQTAATQAYADTAAGNAFSSVNVLQKLNDSITGVSITSLGYIFSAGKTTYQSDTNGWFIGYNEPPFVVTRTPVMYIGNATNHMKWTGSSLEVRGNITGSTFTGGTFRTGPTTSNRVEMISGTTGDRITFPLIQTNDTPPVSISETQSAYIRIVPTDDGDAGFARILELKSPTVSGFNPPSTVKLMTGRGTTASNSSRVIIESPWVQFSGVGTFASGSQTITMFGIPDYSNTSTTASYVLGSSFGYQLAWFDAADFGGGSSYQAGNGIAIDTSTNPDTINNTGYRMNGSTSNPAGARSSTQNRITFGAIGTTGSVPSGRSDGDLHIEY